MELLKEAIFTEEEIELVIELVQTLSERRHAVSKEVSDRLAELTNNDPFITHLKKIPGMENVIKERIEIQKGEYVKKTMAKAVLAGKVLTKMYLYKNCVSNSD